MDYKILKRRSQRLQQPELAGSKTIWCTAARILSEGHKSDLFAEIRPSRLRYGKNTILDLKDDRAYLGSDIDAVRIAGHNWKSTTGLEE